VTDLLGSITEGVGKLTEPIAPALDFFMPQTGPQLDEGGIGGLVNSVGRGIQSAAMEGPMGMAAIAGQAITGQGSARERLMMGGLALLGAGMTARQAHSLWGANRLGRPVKRAMPTGYRELVNLGERPRFVDDVFDEIDQDALDLAMDLPGLPPRMRQILAPAEDNAAIARGFGRWDANDEFKTSAGAALFESYAQQLGQGARAAQVDFARFEHAMSSGLLPASAPGNKPILELWRRATNEPESFVKDTEAQQALFGAIQLLGDATAEAAVDMTTGYVGRITRVVFTDDGAAHLGIWLPVDWSDGRIVNPLVRAQRLKEMNMAALSEHGEQLLTHLYRLGVNEFNEFAETGTTRLPKGLALGPEWYPRARQETAQAFSIDELADGGTDRLKRAVAAVSFLSEAEEWETNIFKAKAALDRAGDVSDVDFQGWLANGTTLDGNKRKWVGTREADRAHQARFSGIWESLKSEGFKVDERTMKKVLRLYGGVETVEEVFRTTAARKQKNFYLNIMYPDLEYPVTVDRHAYDAFLGFDTGIEDRPLDAPIGDGDQYYDVVGDTYRRVARNLGISVNALQAVIWEPWRMLKKTHPRNGWARQDPFVVHLPGETTNPALEALLGRGNIPFQLGASTGDGPLPLSVLEVSSAENLSALTVGDSAVVLANVSDRAGTSVPHLTPAVKGTDGIERWVRVKPLQVQDASLHRNFVEQDPLADVATYLNADLPNGHPATRNETIIEMYLPDDVVDKFRVPRGGGRATYAGRVERSFPELEYARLSADDLDPETFADSATSPLRTHAWATIATDLDEAQIARAGITNYDSAARYNELRARLIADGYKPIPQQGVYGGAPEPSFLVFGIKPEDALRYGEMFQQDSVLVNDGFLYNRKLPVDPETAGQLQPSYGVDVGIDQPDYRSTVNINGTEVQYAALMDFRATEPVDLDALPRRNRNSMQRVEVVVPNGRDLSALADEFETRGARNLAIYANASSLDGFERAYETVASDGVQTVATRTVDGRSFATHGRHVFVRSTAGLSKSRPAYSGFEVLGDGRAVVNNTLVIDGRFPGGAAEFKGPFDVTLDGKKPVSWGYRAGTLTPIFDAAEASSGLFDAVITKNRLVPGDPNDLTPAIYAAQHLEDAGWPGNLVLETDKGRFDFFKQPKKDPTPEGSMALTANGLVVPKYRPDGTVKRFRDQFGFDLVDRYRVDHEWRRLPAHVVDAISAATGEVMDRHARSIHRARLRGLSVEFSGDKIPPYAYMHFGPDSPIILSREWWGDQDAFLTQLMSDRAEGFLTPRAASTPHSIVVHELGHVLDLSVRLDEGMKKASPFWKEVRDMATKAGPGGWRKNATLLVSETAATEPSELVAEAVSEVLTPAPGQRPSALALNIYDLLADRLEAGSKYRKVVSW
jgi:hypothetical protein